MRALSNFLKVKLNILSIVAVIFVAFILTFLANIFAPAQVFASTQDFYFKDGIFDYYLENASSGSTLHVKETLTAVFPNTNQNHGITRIIPYTNQSGKNITAESQSALGLTVTRNGNSEPISKVEKEDGNYIFYIGSSSEYVHGEQVYVIEYDFKNVITEFTSSGALTWNGKDAYFQELFWDTNGTGWSQRFDSLTANVHIPAAYAKNLRTGTSCYVGYFGTKNTFDENTGSNNISSRCTVSSDDATTYNSRALNASQSASAETTLTFETRNLAAGENLSFAIDFDAGTFTVPEPSKNYTLVIFVIIEAIISIIVIILSIIKYHQLTGEKRSLDKSLFVKPEYVPPKGLTVAESAAISIPSTKSSFVATLMELAVAHRIELKKSTKKGVLASKDSWSVIVKSTDGLSAPQHTVLKILNGGTEIGAGQEIEIKKHTATSTLESLKKSYSTDTISMLKDKSLLENKPKNIPGIYTIIPVVLILVFSALVYWVIDSHAGTIVGGDLIYIIAVCIPVITIFINSFVFSRATRYTKRTNAGIEISKYLEGLKLYITMAEKDRINFLQSVKGADVSPAGIVKLYEKLLPYACIFGVEESWMGELNKYYKEHPEIEHGWYYGTDYLTIAAFHSFYSTTSSTIASSTSYSSSSSGGSGGGFSGGGGGGGGGGGW